MKNIFILSFADIIPMAQQIQTVHNQSEKVKLSEMPMIILEQILIHLDDDKALLTASHVCKSFAAAAETVFERKYSKAIYSIDFWWMAAKERVSKISFHQIMLSKYGANVHNIEIVGGEELLDLIEQKCRSLEMVKLDGVRKMLAVKGLKEIHLMAIGNLNRQTFGELINNNQQLEVLEMREIDVDLLDILDGRLNQLKTLEYLRETSCSADLPKIRLNSLEAMELNLPDNGDYVRLLRAMDCNKIKSLKLTRYHHDIYDKGNSVLNAICAFKSLVSLHLPDWPVTKPQIQKLAHRLRNLTEFRIKMAQSAPNVENIIGYALLLFSKLTKLTIELDHSDFGKFLEDVSIYDFHRFGCYANYNTEIDVICWHGAVSTSKDRIYVCDGRSIELHWMDNLNEMSVRKVMKQSHRWDQIEKIKFIGQRTECSLDISTFMNTNWTVRPAWTSNQVDQSPPVQM